MGAIGNITPSDAATAARPPLDRISLGIAGGLALALLVLAMPRLAGEMNVIGARTVVAAALENRPDKRQNLPAQTYAKAADAIDDFGGVTGDARLLADRGLLLLRRSGMETAQAPLLLREAMDATIEGLARNPGNTDAWARLAYLRARTGDRLGAGQAFRMSLLAAPLSPQLMPSRLRLGLDLLDSLNEEQRRLLSRQVRLLWVIQPSALTWQPMDERAQEFIAAALDGLTQADMDHFIRLHRKNDGEQR